MYSVKAIASLTGLGAETLRAWERRYQAIVPDRDDGGRRFYSQDDLDRLLLLADLTRKGHAISKVAGLPVSALRSMVSNVEQETSEHGLFAQQIVEALQDYRIERCEQLLKRALIAHEPLPFLRDILTPALAYVGQLWHDEKLSIAQEHMFSSSVKRILLSMVHNMHSLSGNRPSMLFATPPGEPHVLGILMCCLLAAEQHYNCYYLGASMPAKDLVDASQKLKVDIIVLGLVKTPPDKETLEELAVLMAAPYAQKIKVWMGGSGAAHWMASQTNVPSSFEILADLDDFHSKASIQRQIL